MTAAYRPLHIPLDVLLKPSTQSRLLRSMLPCLALPLPLMPENLHTKVTSSHRMRPPAALSTVYKLSFESQTAEGLPQDTGVASSDAPGPSAIDVQ